MTNSDNHKPTAFVIMPFDDEFNAVYDDFIRATLEDVGFLVSRADTHLHMENVMRSVVRGIDNASLVVADISLPNENVYYELGLAHALDRPVVLLTAHLEALPFDLRLYRVIEYSTHFARMPQAKLDLQQVARGFLDRSLSFRSPVADFLDRPVKLPSQQLWEELKGEGRDESSDIPIEDDGEPGLLDNILAFQESFDGIRSAMESITARSLNASSSLSSGTERLETIEATGTDLTGKVREKRVVVMAMAQDLNGFAKGLATDNDSYERALEQAEPAVEGILTHGRPNTEEDYEELENLLPALESAEESMQQLRSSTSNTMRIIRGTPNYERSLNKANTNVIGQLQRIVNNTDRMIAMLSRSRLIVEERLETRDGERKDG